MAEHIELSVPAQHQYLYLARLTVGAVASRIEMTIDEVEDLHLAVEELCLTLLFPADLSDARLCMELSWDDDAIEVMCRVVGGPADPALADASHSESARSISRRLLDALVDEHGAREDGADTVAWLRKRRMARAVPDLE